MLNVQPNYHYANRTGRFPGRPRLPLGAEGSHSGALEARDRYLRDQGAFKEHKGLRLPGTAIPGLYYAGSFFYDGQRRFYNVRRNTPIVVITLINEGYDRLILSVENPATVIERVTGHLLNKA